MLCSVAVSGVMLPTVPDLQGKKENSKRKQAWKEVALHPPLSAGQAGGLPYGSGTGGAPATPLAADFGPGQECAEEGRSARLGGCFLRLPPPTSGLARRRQRRGALLDRKLLSTPLADFGPGPEAVAGRGVCFLHLPPSTLGLAQRGRLRGPGRAAGDISFYSSRRRLWAWLGGGRRRGAQLDGEFALYASCH